MTWLKIGEQIKLLKINLDAIEYRDWIGERDPVPGDIARVQRIFDGLPITYLLCCEPKPGFPLWGVQIKEAFIEYEIVG